MYEIVIDVSKIALLDNPRDFILEIPTKIFSSTNPPISPNASHIGYKVILQNSKADDALNPNSIKEVLTKLQTRFEELMRANYSDAGYQQIRDAQKKPETNNTTDTQPQPPSPIPSSISPQVPQSQIQKNAPNPHPSSNQSSNKISNLPTSIFSKNSANPSSNPFISGSAGGGNSFFNNPSSNTLRPNSSLQHGQNQNRQQQNSMNIFGNSVNFAQSGQFPTNIGAGMYSQQNNQSSGQLFTDPHRSTTQRSTASRQKRHNLA